MTTAILLIFFVLLPLVAMIICLMLIEAKQNKEKHEIRMQILKKINSVLPEKKEKDKKDKK